MYVDRESLAEKASAKLSLPVIQALGERKRPAFAQLNPFGATT